MKTLFFLYHELRPVPSRYSYITPCDEFERHCELFRSLQRADRSGHLRPEVTFDDGNRSDYAFALPLLERYGLKAHFFITAGWTAERPGFMGGKQLGELRRAGHTIGAHGWSHKLLTACSPAELDRELRGARQRLEDGLGEAVTVMSLPGGRANSRVVGACQAAGYSQVFTSVPKAEDMTNARLVGRLNLLNGTTVDWLQRVLDPTSGKLDRLYRADRLKTGAKAILGDSLYASLWALVNRKEPDSADSGAPAA